MFPTFLTLMDHVLYYTIYVKYIETISGKMTLKLLKPEVPQLQYQHPAVPQRHTYVMLSGITFSSVYCYFIVKCDSALLFTLPQYFPYLKLNIYDLNNSLLIIIREESLGQDMMKGRGNSLLDVMGLNIEVAGKMGMVDAVQRALIGRPFLPFP